MDLSINKEYKYITFIDSFNNIISGPKKIIYSPQINHELLAMMFVKNFDNIVIIPNQLTYGSLSDDEISTLSQMGCMQFDLYNENQQKYEYKSLLNTVELTVVDVPKDAVFIYLQSDLDEEGDIIDVTTMTTSKKLMLLAQSPDKIENLSQEIHDSMISPHNQIDQFVLFTKDLNNFQSMALVDENLIDRQALIKLGELMIDYEDSGDTEYCKGKIGLLPLHKIDNSNKICTRSNVEFIEELKKLYNETITEDELHSWVKL